MCALRLSDPEVSRRHVSLEIVGATLRVLSNAIYFGDESNQNAPLPGYHVIDLHSSFQLQRHLEVFGSINNLLNTKYSTFGIYSDPTGVGAPGAMKNSGGLIGVLGSPSGVLFYRTPEQDTCHGRFVTAVSPRPFRWAC